MLKQELIDYIKNNCFTKAGQFRGMWFAVSKDAEWLKMLIIQHTPNCKADDVAERVYWLLNGLETYKSCPECHNDIMGFKGISYGYHDTCSRSCAIKSDKVRTTIKQNNIAKYGIDNPAKLQSVKDKTKQTNLERYGTNYPASNEEVKAKVKETNLTKYGVEYASQLKEVKEKTKSTNLDRYGAAHPLKNPIIYEKVKTTNLDRYGVPHVFHKKAGRREWLTSQRENWWHRRMAELAEIVIPAYEHAAYVDVEAMHPYSCVKCNTTFLDHLNNGRVPRCTKCNPGSQVVSNTEREILAFIEENYTGQIIKNSRNIIKPKELDFYLPAKNLAIEFNGDYWHSFNRLETKEERYRHAWKYQECEKQNIQLIQISENEWKEKQAIVKSRLINLLGYSQKIYARKCQVIELTNLESSNFLKNTHVQGNCKATVKLGLMYDNELVAVMTFGRPRYNKHYEWELLRYSSKLNTNVIGGASKLLTYFKHTYLPKSIISYADLRWSKGNLYTMLGFDLSHVSQPSYWWTNHLGIHHRSKFQKHKLLKLLGDKFDAGKTEAQNMFDAGYRRLWDCGTMVFIWTST